MKIIGLCGGSGSGKSEVCSFIISLGIPVIDADAVYHEITSKEGPCLEQLRLEFGDEIISCGALDRKALSKIVFESG
jgi:dephospho-CoA kinase